jgi:hypothetical protein
MLAETAASIFEEAAWEAPFAAEYLSAMLVDATGVTRLCAIICNVVGEG